MAANRKRSTAQVLPTNELGNAVIPLTEAQDGQTPFYTIRRVTGVSAEAGDEVFVLASEQIDNESHGTPGDPWLSPRVVTNVGLKKDSDGKIVGLRKRWNTFDLDPRRTLEVMVEMVLVRRKNGGEATRLSFARGPNLNNLTHHGPQEMFDTDFIREDGSYTYETWVRFGWTPLYWFPGAKMEVLPRGMLSARRLP